MNQTSAVPKRLGRYEIESEIGRGMMGVVFRARDPELDRTVALKVVHLAATVPEADLSSVGERFMAEARASAGLSHPGIVVVYDVGRDPETEAPFIAFEYLQGRTLAEIVAAGAPMEWRAALNLIARVAEALHHAHAQGVIHRDIKPANIMVLPSGEAKVMDFGIAKVRSSNLTAAGEFLGTPLYMSPEQAAGEPADGRSDIFSLGSVLYLLLTGMRPFDADSVFAVIKRVTEMDPAPPSRLVPALPPRVDDIIARTLAKRREDRYPNGQTLAADLDSVLAGQPIRSMAELARVSQEPLGATLRPDGPSETIALKRAALPSRRRADRAPQSTRQVGAAAPPSGWGRAHTALALAGVVALGAAASSVFWKVEPPPIPSPTVPAPAIAAVVPAPVEPAQLAFALRHSLQDGTVRLWIGEELVLDEPLRRGHGQTRQVHEVRFPPGDYMLRAEVRTGTHTYANRTEGSFASGTAQRLEAIFSGLPGARDSELVLFPLRGAALSPADAEETSSQAVDLLWQRTALLAWTRRRTEC